MLNRLATLLVFVAAGVGCERAERIEEEVCRYDEYQFSAPVSSIYSTDHEALLDPLERWVNRGAASVGVSSDDQGQTVFTATGLTDRSACARLAADLAELVDTNDLDFTCECQNYRSRLD